MQLDPFSAFGWRFFFLEELMEDTEDP